MVSLTILVGLPGSGKSTWANAAANNAIVISSDKLRGIIGVDESDQSVSPEVFRTMFAMTHYFLSEGKAVVIDATNVSKKSRAPFIAIARKYSAHVVACVANTPAEICKARNNARARVVPEFVIDRMAGAFEMPLVGEVDEVRILG